MGAMFKRGEKLEVGFSKEEQGRALQREREGEERDKQLQGCLESY